MSTSPVEDKQLIRLLQDVALVANRASSQDEAIAKALDLVFHYTGWSLGHVYAWDDGGKALRATDQWYGMAPLDLAKLRQHTQATPFPIGQGYPGRVVATGRAVAVADLRDPTSPAAIRQLVESGVRGYLAFPILLEGDRIEAVVECFAATPVVVSEQLINVLTNLGVQIGLVARRERTELALRESEQRFRAIFNQSFQFIGLMQPDGTLIEANETALIFGGLRRDEVVGKPFWEARWWTISATTQAQLRQAIARAARGEFIRYEVDVLGEEEQIATIDFSIKPITNQRGEVVLLIPEGRDITEQRIMIDRLQTSERRLAEAQSLARLGHYEWRVQEDQVFWSAELVRIYGLDNGESPRCYEDFLKLVHPEDRAELIANMDQAIANGGAFQFMHRIIRPDGTERLVIERGQVELDEDGTPRRVTGTGQDVTEQQQTELELFRTVQQVSAVTTMGQAIAASLELEFIYEQVLKVLKPQLSAETLLIFLHDEQKHLLEIVAVDDSDLFGMAGLKIADDAGVAGMVLASGEAALMRGETLRKHLATQLVRSTGYKPNVLLAVPMRWQDKTVGILEATHSDEAAFDAQDLRLMVAAATWTAIAIGNARQHAQLQRRVRESEAIARVSQALSETLELNKILKLIVEAAETILPRVDWAAIHLLDERKQQLRPAAVAGLDIVPEDYILEVGKGIAGHAVTEGRLINVEDLQQDPRRLAIDQKLQARSLLVAPIQSGTGYIGTLSVQYATPNSYDEDDERLLNILAAQAGILIENARLFTFQRRARLLAEAQRERLRKLTAQVVSAQEEERLRISRELHDEAGQALTFLKINLELLQRRLPDSPADLKQDLAEIIALADETMENLRTLSHNLRPPGLDTFGLHAALGGLCQEFTARIEVPVVYKGIDLPELPPATSLSLYRLVQEALTNVAKHANASQVEVTLQLEDDRVTVTVSDDGRGFTLNEDEPLADQVSGIGLLSMGERLEQIGGELRLSSARGGGTRVTARIPIPISRERA